MEPSASEQVFTLVGQNLPLIIFFTIFPFIYASFGRAKIFHFEKPARVIMSLALSLAITGVIQTAHWESMTTAVAAIVAGGIVGFVTWTVALHRGKTRHEEEQKWRGKFERRQ